MSKFLNYSLPTAGGAALILGTAYGLSTRTYQDDVVASLQTQLEQREAVVANATAEAAALDEQVAAISAENDALQARASGGGSLTDPAPVADSAYGLGREAHIEEIAAWDVDVLPDGRGLPEGSGDVWTGEELFVEHCAACHGDFAEGVDNWPVLAGGFDTLADEDPVKTVGSYWPYLSTVWDYSHRSMPFGNAGTLSPDDTYAIVAYILYSNNLVDDDFELSNENFLDVEMHNAEGFVLDDRDELEYAQWRAEPCMENCKDAAEITMRASVVDVTPETEGEAMAEEAHTATTEAAPAEEATAEAAPAEEAPATETAALDPALVAAGEAAFRACRSCHQVGDGATNRTGPALNGIVGQTIGAVDGFRYSGTFEEANANGAVWDAETLAAFLADPRGSMPGTKMSYAGMRSEDDIAAMIAYLSSFEAE